MNGGKIWGNFLCVLGIAMMVLTGTCSTYFIVASKFSPGLLAMAAVFGGVPFGIGLLIFYAGQSVLRSEPSSSPPKE